MRACYLLLFNISYIVRRIQLHVHSIGMRQSEIREQHGLLAGIWVCIFQNIKALQQFCNSVTSLC